jgi:serine/threonine protein kinase
MDESIAHYRLLERIGEGGLGEVFRARDTRVGRTVALKLLPRGLLDKPTRRDRFVADATAAAALSHPNIATLFDTGEHEGRRYLAYEFVAGESLRQVMAGRPMPQRHALEIAIQIADALAEAHARGVIHKDLRPENVAITGKGSSRLLDTGMAGWTRGGAARARAAAAKGAGGAGVSAYMSPEEIAGQPADARTDLFSLGVIVHEMLTGRTPAPGTSASADLPKELQAVVGRAIARDAASRQQSAVSLAAELRSVVAMLDVRSGETIPGSLIPIDDDTGGAGKWWAAGAVAAAIIVAAWFWFR